MTHRWRTVDFRPAPFAGWRALFINTPTGRYAQPVVGWLVQEEIEYDGWGNRTKTGARRIVAGIVDDCAEVEPVNETSNYWCVLAPGELEPSVAEETEEREAQEELRRIRREQAKARAVAS